MWAYLKERVRVQLIASVEELVDGGRHVVVGEVWRGARRRLGLGGGLAPGAGARPMHRPHLWRRHELGLRGHVALPDVLHDTRLQFLVFVAAEEEHRLEKFSGQKELVATGLRDALLGGTELTVRFAGWEEVLSQKTYGRKHA